MKKKFLISIISIALVIALGSTAVSAMQCGKYSYCTAGYLYAQSTAHLAVNADSTYTY